MVEQLRGELRDGVHELTRDEVRQQNAVACCCCVMEAAEDGENEGAVNTVYIVTASPTP